MRAWLLLLLSIGFNVAALGNPPAVAGGTVRKHLVYFRDKTGTPFSTTRPDAFLSARALQRRSRQQIPVSSRDLPVAPAYVAQVRAVPGVQLWYTSRWFNAAVISCDSATLAQVQALPIIRSAETLNRKPQAGSRPALRPALPQKQSTQSRRADYGLAFAQAAQLDAVTMHDAGFKGEGMQIAVFDAGFPSVDQLEAFKPLFSEKRVASTFNFVDKTKTVFERDAHGTSVLSALAANTPGFFVGTAPQATYHLCITEDASSEHPVEEMNWLIAAEYADSAGVDIISSSLGYTTFDEPSIDHTYPDLNGRTTIGTRAATMAARVGMVVLNSAGNDGDKPWRYIDVPADADSVIAVGAVDSLGVRAGFSSVGPTADGRIKPDLMAMGYLAAVIRPSGVAVRGNGTSYACPVLAGMVAGLWQSSPGLSAQQVIETLKRSGSQAANPDNERGYGIPNFVRAYELANPGKPLSLPGKATGLLVYPNPTASNELFLTIPEELLLKNLRVRVYDSRGALVLDRTMFNNSPKMQVRTGVLARGTYTCTVSSNGVRRTARFVRL
ncbi:S8 family serine peptidase [Hymenobacter sp. BT730]|uniref:S8 family serine peptidase n=1 Tax=Hymenobacter sp. BT730 TaxID=3063332 RepID=UPI0026E0DFED|nr:S8 family serine peptidase [Hymenobacter sp. BT730]